MKGIALLIVLVIVLVVIYFTAKAVVARFSPSVWRVETHPRGDYMDVILTRMGDQEILVENIELEDSDFNQRMIDATREARRRARTMNRGEE